MAKFYRLKIISDKVRHRPEMDKKDYLLAGSEKSVS